MTDNEQRSIRRLAAVWLIFILVVSICAVGISLVYWYSDQVPSVISKCIVPVAVWCTIMLVAFSAVELWNVYNNHQGGAAATGKADQVHQGGAVTSYESQDLRKQLEQRGFRPERIERALTERRIKDGKPYLSYPALAMKAGEELGGEVEVTEDDVRNDYRDAGWTWERSGKVR